MPYKSSHADIAYPCDKTVWSWLFESAKFDGTHPDENVHKHVAINAATREKMTYWQMKENSEHLSSAIVNICGLQQNDAVILFSPNSVWYPVAMHAVVRVGGIVGGSSPSSTVEEMAWTLRISRARYVITALQSLQTAVTASFQAGIPPDRVIVIDGNATGHHSVKDLIESSKRVGKEAAVPPFRIPEGKTNAQICGYLSFTSGTTGKPKACMISHQNVIAQCHQMDQITSPNIDKVLAVLPLYHITGLIHLLHLPIFRMADVVLMPKFDLKSMLDTITHYGIPEVNLVPPLLIRILEDRIASRYDLRCIQVFASGSAQVPPRILKLLQERFPHAGFKQGWGMTESSSCLTVHDPLHYSFEYSETVGPLVANTELMFVDSEGNETEGVGEILARGPQCSMGYLDDDQATRATFGKDGWLRTGDMGRMLPNGCVQITGRLKEIIKVKGVGVSPVELEELLLGHPAVEDVAVIGIPDEYSGERPHAYVVVRDGAQPSMSLASDLVKYSQVHKLRLKWIRSVSFLREIPRAGSGKILRQQLRGQGGNLSNIAVKL